MAVLLRNNVTATLATALSATDTGIALTSGHGARFPSLGAAEYFYATLSGPTTGPEIVKVTTRVGDALTVVRAQEGTVGQHFPSGGRVEMRVTAASITDLVDEHDQASEITIADAGGYYTSTNVEGALQEAAVYNQGGTGATTRTVRSRLQDYISVKDFGAVGNGVTNDTTAIQAAINAAQAGFGKLYVPEGTYNVTGLTYDGDKPLDMQGAGEGSFSGSALVNPVTLFCLTQTSAKLFQRTSGGNSAVKTFSRFSVKNTSGGSAETAFYSENGTLCNFEHISGYGFQYGIRHQRTVYSQMNGVQFRGCVNGFNFTNITATVTPYVLNALGSDGYFNNCVSFRNCHAITGTTGFAIAGVTVEFENCDASGNTTGFLFGGTDYPITMVSAQQLYGESSTGTFIQCTNTDLDVGGIFVASNYTSVVTATGSRVWIAMIRSNAFPVTFVTSTNSFVTVENSRGGYSGGKWSQSGTGKVRFLADEDTSQTTLAIANGATQDVLIDSSSNRSYAVDIMLYENGTTRWALTVFVRGSECYSPHSKPTNISFASVINVNGNYDLRISNTAGFPYNFTGYAKPRPLHYTMPLKS